MLSYAHNYPKASLEPIEVRSLTPATETYRRLLLILANGFEIDRVRKLPQNRKEERN